MIDLRRWDRCDIYINGLICCPQEYSYHEVIGKIDKLHKQILHLSYMVSNLPENRYRFFCFSISIVCMIHYVLLFLGILGFGGFRDKFLCTSWYHEIFQSIDAIVSFSIYYLSCYSWFFLHFPEPYFLNESFSIRDLYRSYFWDL